MDEQDRLTRFRTALMAAVIDRPHLFPFQPLSTSPWIAMSLMQKAIRRGYSHTALSAAASLLQMAPQRLWRRIGCIAFEDIGVADLKCVGLVTAALTSKAMRKQLGGEWAVASLVVEKMADANKNRSADNLLMTVEQLPHLVTERSLFATMPEQRLREIILGCPDLHKRALALWYLMGTTRWSSNVLAEREGNSGLAFATLAEHGVSPSVIAITEMGFRKTGEMLAPFMALLTLENGIRGKAVRNDTLPTLGLAGNIPSYALDTYTREGKQAFALFLNTKAETASWINENRPKGARLRLLGELVFRVEGGQLIQRSAGPAADALRKQYEVGCLGTFPEEASTLLALMRKDIGQLNACRAQVMEAAKNV